MWVAPWTLSLSGSHICSVTSGTRSPSCVSARGQELETGMRPTPCPLGPQEVGVMWVSPGALLEYPLEGSFLLGLSRAFAVPSVPSVRSL